MRLRACCRSWANPTVASATASQTTLPHMNRFLTPNLLDPLRGSLHRIASAAELLRNLGQIGAHRLPCAGILEETDRLNRNSLPAHLVLDQLGNDPPAGH